jgi:hypothetical protein
MLKSSLWHLHVLCTAIPQLSRFGTEEMRHTRRADFRPPLRKLLQTHVFAEKHGEEDRI